jgi:phage terminase large subunit-like protein
MVCVYVIDPVPPPSDKELLKGLKGKDFEAHAIVGVSGDNRYLLDYALMRGHEPTWTVKTFFEFQAKYRPYKCLVESVAYQRTLAWILRKAMDEMRQWYSVIEYVDKRSKFNRIVGSLNGVSSSGRLFVKDSQVEFIEQFSQYPELKHDDLLDAVAIAIADLAGMAVNDEGQVFRRGDERAPPPILLTGAP